ncbi:hypothetical protein RvY_11804 [Ramazzottius varieornatus]|uniref:Uncharacterized protein n=1 Tax=Ramazzottius varieornatus TaxID=947166 RepID=A0A1D1VMP9_RAMVA|nr:hypothetical protein RvY_11804 [Ramazzottius varieornatus]
MVYPTCEDVIRIIAADEGCRREFLISVQYGKFTAYCHAFGHEYKGLPSCCETCAINSCAKMVYQDLKDRCLLKKVTKDGKTLPIPAEDYFCWEELKKNENDLLMELDIDEGISES